MALPCQRALDHGPARVHALGAELSQHAERRLASCLLPPRSPGGGRPGRHRCFREVHAQHCCRPLPSMRMSRRPAGCVQAAALPVSSLSMHAECSHVRMRSMHDERIAFHKPRLQDCLLTLLLTMGSQQPPVGLKPRGWRLRSGRRRLQCASPWRAGCLGRPTRRLLQADRRSPARALQRRPQDAASGQSPCS